MFVSMFEPVHGSAPDIAGRGIANPIATLWSVQMMLDFLGQADAAGALMDAIKAVSGTGFVTPDLGGTATTTAFTDRVLEQLNRRQGVAKRIVEACRKKVCWIKRANRLNRHKGLNHSS